MNVNQILTFDNFLDDPNLIRNQALLLNYSEPQLGMGWKGYRCLEENELSTKLIDIIKNKLSEKNSLFNKCNLRCYFHYTIKNQGSNNDNIHKDFEVDYAGVLYLTPNPQSNSGTSFYNNQGKETIYLENIYNRFVFYPANEWHSLKNSFGDNLENGRLTFTVFCTLKEKNNKTII